MISILGKKITLAQYGVETGEGRHIWPLQRRHLATVLGSRDGNPGHCIMKTLEPWELEELVRARKESRAPRQSLGNSSI